MAITDGVTDTLGPGDERFGAARLRELLGEVRDHSPAAIRERLIAELERFQVGAQADDTALVAMRRMGTARVARLSTPGETAVGA